MCQVLVGKVTEVNGTAITVEREGKREKLNAKLVAVEKGDYVTFSKGMAIEKIDKEEADMLLGNLE
jgi:hydrogenase maturation factor